MGFLFLLFLPFSPLFLPFLQGKCEKYWPDKSAIYGNLLVKLSNEETHADYIIRDFVVGMKLEVWFNFK